MSKVILAILTIVSLLLTTNNIITFFNPQQVQAIIQTANDAVIASSQPSTTTTNNFLTYTNSTYGIKVHYPPDWVYKGHNKSGTSVQNVVTFASLNSLVSDSGKFPVLLYIGIEKLPYYNIPLALYTNLTINNLRQAVSGFELIKSNTTNTTIAGSPANKIVFTSTNGLKTMAVFTIKGNEAYVIEYISAASKYPSYLPIAQKMVDSFDIINTNTAASMPSNINQTQSFLTYTNSTYGIKIQYPSDWKIEHPRNPTIVVRFHSPTVSVLGIEIENLPPNTKLVEKEAAVINLLSKAFAGFKLIGSIPAVLADNAAERIVYTVTQGKIDLKFMQVITIKVDKGYTITYGTTKELFANDLPTVHRMIDSFQITR